MRFDWTVTLGDIMATLAGSGVIAAIFWGVVKVRDDLRGLQQTLSDFPPHRHVGPLPAGHSIVYPKMGQ